MIKISLRSFFDRRNNRIASENQEPFYYSFEYQQKHLQFGYITWYQIFVNIMRYPKDKFYIWLVPEIVKK